MLRLYESSAQVLKFYYQWGEINGENNMNGKEILNQALSLKPEERFLIVEGLLKSLDEPDRTIDEIWTEEAEKRLQAYREGRLEKIPMEEIFQDQ